MKFLLCLCAILCESPLSSPIFKRKNDKYTAELPFLKTLDVLSYEIMVGTLDAGEGDFIILDKKKDQKGSRDSIEVKLDIIKKNDKKHQYSICVEVVDVKGPKKWYSESFRFDSRNKEWVLSRAYEEEPFYIKYATHIMILSGIGGVGLIGLIISRYMNKKSNESSL